MIVQGSANWVCFGFLSLLLMITLAGAAVEYILDRGRGPQATQEWVPFAMLTLLFGFLLISGVGWVMTGGQ